LTDRPSRERRRELRQNKFSESEKEEEKCLADIVTFNGRPETVEELLKQIGLEVNISFFKERSTLFGLFFTLSFCNIHKITCLVISKIPITENC